jgi:hypothetical protein
MAADTAFHAHGAVNFHDSRLRKPNDSTNHERGARITDMALPDTQVNWRPMPEA